MRKPNAQLQQALTTAGFSQLQCVADLGFVGWKPPPQNSRGAPYRYKHLQKATVAEILHYTQLEAAPDAVVTMETIQPPIAFQTNKRQLVAQIYPYGAIGIAALFYARSKRCDLQSTDFYFGGSALEVLSRGSKFGKNNKAPYYVMKVPGTNMIMLRYSLNFRQDYGVPGFQFERLMTGKRLEDRHDIGFTEHVQVMKIGNFSVLMAAEADARDDQGHPVEMKLCRPQNQWTTKLFFQMVGSGSLTLRAGKNQLGQLTSVWQTNLTEMAEVFAENQDVGSIQAKLIHNMERLKDWDQQGCFEGGKVYRVDFNSGMELHPISDSLLPPEPVVQELLHNSELPDNTGMELHPISDSLLPPICRPIAP